MSLLTPTMSQRAQLLNIYYSRRLGWSLPSDIKDAGSGDCAAWVADQQRDSGVLRVDGILGPKTWAYLRGSKWNPPLCNHLIVNGTKISTPLPVVSFEHPEGLSFIEHSGWDERQEKAVDTLVLHWDGCRSSHDCFHVLMYRNLSVHLLLDGDGTLYQCLDLVEARAWHARSYNERSIGIEIQNPWRAGKDLREFDQDLLSTGRKIVKEQLPHSNQLWEHLDFTDAQKSALQVWVPFLCNSLGISLRLPRTSNGDVPTGLCAPSFSGVCGHYHLQTDKVDPGMSLWPVLEGILNQTESTIDNVDEGFQG